MHHKKTIQKNITDAIALKQQLLADENLQATISQIVEAMIACFKNDCKVLFCGNGGSAADAQHLAAELSGRYYYDRPPLFAEALHVNTSNLTAVANDYSFEEVYARLVEAMGRPGDILVGLSTSGNSPNVVNAMKKAKELGLTTVGFTGAEGGLLKNNCDYLIAIPSTDTPRIQECHILLGHTICQLVEAGIFPK
ncbi:MAG: D-sedoheptulose 7-phosphate isomerase [Saprospiraceae bacterium]|jgi:D-sedoheptulose 7-phosphate isomerase